MNKRYITYASSIAAIALAQVASATNITTNDPHKDQAIGGSPGINLPEAGSVEYHAFDNHTWDLQSFDFNAANNKLTIQGGFDFLTGTGRGGTGGSINGTGYHYPIGDIFIYVGTDPYTVKNNGPANAPNPIDTPAAPDFVIAFDRTGTAKDLAGGLGYTIIAGPGIKWDGTGGTSALYSGLPWLYKSDGTPGAALTASYSSSGTAYTAGFDNSLTVDLTSIAGDLADKDVSVHVTMQCGNDVMWGRSIFPSKTTTVPDGGMTLLMLGGGLLGIGVLRRRLG